MKIALPFLLTSLAASTAMGADIVQRTLTVSARSEVFVEPDEVLISFDVFNVHDEVLDAKQQNDAVAQKVAKVLSNHALTPNETKIVSYNIGPAYDQRRFVGYRVSREFELRFADFSHVDTIINDLVHAAGDGITVDQVKFQIRDQQKPQFEARRLAVERAREKASHLAELNDARIGQALSIEEDVEVDWDTGGYGGGFGGAGAALEQKRPTLAIASQRSPFASLPTVFQNRMQPAEDASPKKKPAVANEAEKFESQLLLAPGLVDLNATVKITFELLPKLQ